MIEREEREGRVIGGSEEANELNRQRELQQRMDIDDSDIVIQGSTTTRISRKQVNHVWTKLSSLEFLRARRALFLFSRSFLSFKHSCFEYYMSNL